MLDVANFSELLRDTDSFHFSREGLQPGVHIDAPLADIVTKFLVFLLGINSKRRG